MYGREPARPAFWKALVLVAPVVALIAWSAHSFVRNLPLTFLVVMAISATFLISVTIHQRILNDWRVGWQAKVLTRYSKRPGPSERHR
jgi:hypothetical protein